eukprot:1109753-Pyramimonas_sp.AAC.1
MAFEIRQYCSSGGALSTRCTTSPSLSDFAGAPCGSNSPIWLESHQARDWLARYLEPALSPMTSHSLWGM